MDVITQELLKSVKLAFGRFDALKFRNLIVLKFLKSCIIRI
mgnify:CR=1 FL=1